MKIIDKIFGITGDRKKYNQNETRIVEEKNELGEISYTIDYFRKWGNHAYMWFTKVKNIETIEEAGKLKDKIDNDFKTNNVIERNVL